MKADVQIQGSTAWHEHRARFRNASETSAVMGLSPWVSPYMLWEIKTGKRKQEENEAMRRGAELEPLARAEFEAETGKIYQPMVMVYGEYSASLDGIDLEGTEIIEIKCPMKGAYSDTWKSVVAGKVPDHYMTQVQHQLMVSKASKAIFVVYDGYTMVGLGVFPDEVMQAEIREAWDKFMEHVNSDTAPELTMLDIKERMDGEWERAASAYRSSKEVADIAVKAADEAKAKLISLTSHNLESGYGVSVTRYWKRGNVDYKKIPELAGIDLDKYRGADREEVKVTILKGEK